MRNQRLNHTVHQGALFVGALGAILFAAFPPIGLPLLVAAFMMQRKFSKQRRARADAHRLRGQERAAQVRILAIKSLR